MNISQPQPSFPPHRRRWLGRSLQSMLAFVTVASIGFGAWALLRTTREKEKGRPVLIVLDASVGIVLPRGLGFWDYQTIWEPDANDIRRAERAISAFLRAKAPALADRLPEYVRQYGGIDAGGRRGVFCSFLHEKELRHWGGLRANLKELSSGVTVIDGGDNFFQLFYDPKTDGCSEFHVNSRA